MKTVSKLIIWLFVLFIALFPLSIFGQERGSNAVPIGNQHARGNTYAVIIGISDYPNLTPLHYADKDALLFKYFLQSEAGGNVPEENINLLLNEEATSANFWVKGGYSWLLSKKPQKGDRVYFYMAGHGDAINQSEYFFLTHDCQPGNDKNNYLLTGNIQLYNLKSRIESLTIQGVEVILIMDACRTGDLPGGKEGQLYFSQSIVERRAGELILLAAGPNQFSYEDKDFGGGHGLFTYYLIKALSGEADEDGDNIVSFVELQDYVKKQVRITSKDKYKNIQIPAFCCSDNDLTTMSFKDEKLQAGIRTLEQLSDIYASNLPKVNNKRGIDGFRDTNQYHHYRLLLAALKQENFKGEGGGQSILNKMIQECPTCEITEAAKKELAVAYLNYGQAKINLHLAGKDSKVSLNSLINPSSNDQMDKASILANEDYEKLERLQQMGFEQAAVWMEDALDLLNNDPFYVSMYQSKIDFLNLYSQLRYVSVSEKDYWSSRIRTLLNKDSSVYNLNLAGLVYNRLKENDLSKSYYLKAIQKAPNWVYPRANLAVLYILDLKDFDEAKSQLFSALSLDSTSLTSLHALGYVEMYLKNYSEAEKWLLKAAEHPESYSSIWSSLADMYVMQGSNEKAIETLQKYLKIHGESEEIYNHLGILYKNEKKFDLAKYYYTQSLKTNQYYVYPYVNLAYLYYDQKYYDTAIALHAIALEIQNDYYLAYRGIADVYVALHKMDSAEYFYTIAAQLDSLNVSNFNELGNFYLNQNKHKLAKEAYLKAIHVDSNYVYAIRNLARVYLQEKDFVSAEKWIKKAVMIDSLDASNFNTYGLFMEKMDKEKEAIEFYKHAAQLDSTYLYAPRNLAILYRKNKDYKNAEIWMLKALKAQPDNFETSIELGDLYKDQKQYTKAKNIFENVLNADSNYVAIYNNLGLLAKEMGDHERSFSWFYKGLSIDSNYMYLYRNIAGVYLKQNKIDSAKHWYQKAYEKEPRQIEVLQDFANFYLYYSKDNILARKFLNEIHALNSGNSYALFNLGKIDEEENKDKEALDNYLKAFLFDSKNGEYCTAIAKLYDKMNQKSHAKIYYEDAINLNRNNINYYLNYFDFLGKNNLNKLQQDAYKASENYFLKMTEESGFEAINHYNLSVLLNYKKQYKEAIHHLKKALNYEPTEPTYYREVGVNYYMEKEIDSALTWFLKAEKLDSTDALTKYYIFYAYARKGEYEKAEKLLVDPLLNQYEDSQKYLVLFGAAQYNKDLNQTLKYSKQLLNYQYKEYKHSALLSSLGWQFSLINQQDSAYYYFTKSYESDSSDFYPLANLTLYYLNHNQIEKANHYLALTQKSDAKDSILVPCLAYSIWSKMNQEKKAIEILQSIPIDNQVDSVSESFKAYRKYIVQLLLEPSNTENLNSLIQLIKKEELTFSELMEYKFALLDPKIYNQVGLKEAIKEMYPYWYE